MDKEDIRIPKYVVKVLAEKLRAFVEDNEKSFKFHPWQVTSTLNKIKKSIHLDLPERAIHHLHDTGTAGEIMKFSKENEKSVKLGKVKNYLYSQLGLYSNMPRALENGCQIIYPESQLYDAMRRNRIFEIRRLVDAVIHQLEQTSKQNGKAYHIQLNSLNKFSNPKTPQKQTLAHCNFTCCLFYGHEKRNEKKKIFKRSPRSVKINFIKRNIKKTSQKYSNRMPTSQNILPKIYLSPRNMPTLTRSKTLVDSTTQTTWSLKAPRRESLYEDEALDISMGEESMESESDFYCKSDTLNDASMITDQIASEFVQDITQSEIKNEKTLSKMKSSRSSAMMSKFTDQSKSSTKEITKNNSENNMCNELEMNDNSISSLNSIKLEAIEGTVNLFKSMEIKTNENTETKTKSKSVFIGNSKNDDSYSKCFESDAIQNNVTNSKSDDLELSSGNAVDVKSAEMEVMSNNSNSSNLETVKDSKIHSKSHHSEENKNNNSQSKTHQTEKLENGVINSNAVKIEASTNKLENTEVQPDLKIDSPTHHDSAQPNQENHRMTRKIRKPKKPLLGLISSYARKVALSRCKTSLIESTEDNNRKGALSRCKTSLLESMEDQPDANQEQKQCEINENLEKIPADDQENEIHSEQQSPINPSSNGLPVELDNQVAKKEEKESSEIVEKNTIAKPVRKYFGDSFESILNSENDTTYCPKSSISVSDPSISEPETDEASVRSSIKENDNVSLEYSSHWTMEYSSTEASESEDEEFKEKFREYKKHLLEDDEGIAASCEEESSFGMEHHMKEMAVMSAEGKRSLMMIAKQNDGFPTFSYDEDTSYFMDTETFDENLESYEQISCSIVTQEGTYEDSGGDSRTCHDESEDNNTPSYENVPYEEKIKTVDDNSMKNNDKEEEINGILCNENADDVADTEDINNEEVSCNMNNAKEDDEPSHKENLKNSYKEVSENDEGNTSKDQASSNKAVKEAETSLDADDISSNAISQERGYSSISVDEVAYQNSLEIETISKILGEFPLRRDNTITENNDALGMEELSMKDATKISKNNAESAEVSEGENTEQEDEINDENEENSDHEFYSENNVEEKKETENINPEEHDNDNNAELCEEVPLKDDGESKECISEKILSKDFTAYERESEDGESLSEEILSKDFTPHERETENEESKENGDDEEPREDLESIKNNQNEVLDPDKSEEGTKKISNVDTEINEEDQESQNVASSKCESTENVNSNEESRNSSISESNEDLTAVKIDANMNAAVEDRNSSLEDKSNTSDEITENVVSVIEDIEGETELNSKMDEDLSEEQSEAHKTIMSEHENMPGEDDTKNEDQADQATVLDSPLCNDDAVEDDNINEKDDEKSTEETATLKVNNQVYKKSHSADEDLKTRRLLKVLSLTESQPFQDIDLMHEDLLEIVDVDGWNMLHLAASKGLEHFLKKVLQHGLSTEDLTDDNHTALQLAVINNNLKCCKILLKHGASLTTEEGSFDENLIETAGDVSSNIKDLLENYKCNYRKVQTLAETINQFSSEKKDVSQPLPKNALEILAHVTIEDEDEDTEENNAELSTD